MGIIARDVTRTKQEYFLSISLSPFCYIQKMLKFFEKFLDLFFPTECFICQKLGPDLCAECLDNFEAQKISNHDWIVSLWNYRDPNVEILMRSIKNIPHKRLAAIISTKLFEKLRTAKAHNPWFHQISNVLIIPIPIGKIRFRERGYNQAELLAEPLAQLLNRKVVKNVLFKKKHTHKQGTTKSKAERGVNLKDSFGVRNFHQIQNRDILIVDDITTTGSTLLEARKVLLEAGAQNIVAITVAN